MFSFRHFPSCYEKLLRFPSRCFPTFPFAIFLFAVFLFDVFHQTPGFTGLHRSLSPFSPVFTGHRHRFHRSSPITFTVFTGLHRSPSPVSPVFTGHFHRCHRSSGLAGKMSKGKISKWKNVEKIISI